MLSYFLFRINIGNPNSWSPLRYYTLRSNSRVFLSDRHMNNLHYETSQPLFTDWKTTKKQLTTIMLLLKPLIQMPLALSRQIFQFITFFLTLFVLKNLKNNFEIFSKTLSNLVHFPPWVFVIIQTLGTVVFIWKAAWRSAHFSYFVLYFLMLFFCFWKMIQKLRSGQKHYLGLV